MGTRTSVEFVIDLLGRGWSTEQILQGYDHLSREDIHACLAYAGALTGQARSSSTNQAAYVNAA